MPPFGSSLAKAQRYIADKVKRAGANAVFEDEELLELVSFHPTRKVKHVKGFIKQARPPFNKNTLFIMTDTGALFEAGLAKCLRNMYGKFDAVQDQRQRVIQAFRQEANHCESMKLAKARFTTGPCAMCNKKSKLCVDHLDPPFAQILQTFLDKNNLVLSSVATRWAQRTEYVLSDVDLSRRWREHHDECASYQGLCRQCNSAKGSGGFRMST